MEVIMDKIPFDPYDFFGYLASGLAVVIGMELTLGFPTVLSAQLSAVQSAFLILGVYVAGHIIATPSKFVLEDVIVKKLLKSPTKNLFNPHPGKFFKLLFPGYYTALPARIRNKILERVKAEGGETSGESLFLHVRYNSAMLNNDNLLARLTTFLGRYGFARNLSFSCLLVGVAMLAKCFLEDSDNPQLTKYGITAIIAGVLMFYRYLKFFRQYSYEMFNTYAGGKANG
jgi:hypothetical protein